ncbi:MAG: restriction endonuclease subunit S, partial [Bacteroidales bacterium]|nr:restriction endonuclease subunit S [Bacteroidales bacterium]
MLNYNQTYGYSCFSRRNRRGNDNLEQQAQVLYKSWFVDFEPFKDGEFVESEMGEIPVGWTVVKFSDL